MTPLDYSTLEVRIYDYKLAIEMAARDENETRSSTPPDFVIPSEARDLQFAAKCRSLASLGMTIHEGSLRVANERFAKMPY